MADYRETASGLFVPARHIPPKPTQLGFRGRDSFTYNPQSTPSFGYISADEFGYWTHRTINPKTLKSLPVTDILTILVDNSDSLSFAVETYQQFIYQGHDVIPEETNAEGDRAVAFIKEFIDRMDANGDSLQGIIDQFSYSMIVQGGLAGELYFDEMGMEAMGIGIVPPFSLRFEKDEDPAHGVYYRIGQLDETGQFKTLFDKAEPNDTFIYDPVKQKVGRPYGSSPIVPSIFGVLSMLELMDMVMQYTRGQAFPKNILSIDAKDFIDAGYGEEAIQSAIDGAVEDLRSELTNADVTQAAVIGSKIVNTLIGAMNRANLDGVQMMTAILERVQQRGLKIPRILYGGDRQGSSLSEAEGRVEWQTFQKRLNSYRTRIERAFTWWFGVILMHAGMTAKVMFQLDDSDEEGRRMVSERLQMETESYSTAAKDGAISTQEYRSLLFGSDDRFAEFDVKLPEDAKPQDDNDTNPTEDPTDDDGME
jgi:hypothetical protein